MQNYIEINDFIQAASESVEKIARFYNPVKDTIIGEINIISKGSTACIVHRWSEGKHGKRILDATIAFPALSHGARLTRREADIWMGYALHELGHAFNTDAEPWNALAKKSEAHRNILNGLEDVRMERDCASKLTPNALRCLSELNDMTLAEAIDGKVSFDHLVQLPYALATLGRWREMGMAADECAKLWAGIRPERQAWFDTVFARLAKCKDTADCAALALAVYDEAIVLGAQHSKPTQQQQDTGPEPTKDQKGEASQGDDLGSDTAHAKSDGMKPPARDEGDDDDEADGDNADGEGEGGDADGDEGDTDGDQGEGDNTDGEGTSSDKSEEGDEASAGQGGGQADAGDDDDAGNEGDEGDEGDDESEGGEPNEGNASTSKSGGGFGRSDQDVTFSGVPGPEDDITRSASPEPNLDRSATAIRRRSGGGIQAPDQFAGAKIDSKFHERGEWKTNIPYWEAQYAQAYSRATKGTARMRSLLKQLLVSPERIGRTNFEKHGKLGSRDIARAGIGDENVFHKRWLEEGVETAVYVTIDGSSSMSGYISTARDMALSLAVAVQACNLPVEVAVFHDGNMGTVLNPHVRFNGHLEGLSGNSRDTNYQRGDVMVEPGHSCTLRIIKPFDKKVGQCKSAFGFMSQMAKSGTPDYAAIMGSIERVKKRPERRKIVFMLTDGCGHAASLTWASNIYAPKHGVACIGVGIGHNVSKQYPLAMQINPGGDLGSLVTKGMALLLRQAQRNRGAKAA